MLVYSNIEKLNGNKNCDNILCIRKASLKASGNGLEGRLRWLHILKQHQKEKKRKCGNGQLDESVFAVLLLDDSFFTENVVTC